MKVFKLLKSVSIVRLFQTFINTTGKEQATYRFGTTGLIQFIANRSLNL